ncbi:MAG: DNA polymerase III subunit gamma/tau, partial [Saprospiraceae bacterium]
VVSARKYRPNRFEDVVGQEHISQTLKNALKSDQVAHAFLFCGPRGVGKTTCARILAKILNCENRTAENEACNTCSSCVAFNDNASFNIIELDAASNNSVDHIRALTEQVRFPPQKGRYKVFIIDEVHMLSSQAFNAFLKTLEEPPPYAIFILATTEKHKIIPTILSRCQIYDFRRIQSADAVAYLRYICEKEGITAEEDALHSIGLKADGAMRDALSIFDRIVSAAGKHITYKDVAENLNILDYEYYFKILDALLTEDLSNVLLIYDDIVKKGFDNELFISGLGEHLRNLLVCKDEKMLALLDTGEQQRAMYKKQAQLTPLGFILTALGICNECDVKYKTAQHKRLHVEMSLIKMCYIHRAINASAISSTTTDNEKKNPDAEPSSVTAEDSPVTTNTESITSISATAAPQPAPKSISVDTIKPALKTSIVNGGMLKDLQKVYNEVREEHALEKQAESLLNPENLQAAWTRFVDALESPSLIASLDKAELSIDNKKIIVKVGSKLAQESIKQTIDLLDYLRKELNDRELMMEIELDQEKIAELAADAEQNRPLTIKEKYEKMVEENPLVDVLRQTFELKLGQD